MDPKQWPTEHASIQDIPGPLDLLHPCNHLTKTVIICSAAEIRRVTYSEKRAEYPGGHRIIENEQNNHVGDSAKQAGGLECVR